MPDISAPDLSSLRVFVGLYGLNRSLRWTWRSIDRCFLRPLAEAGVQVQVAAHFNMPKVVDNLQSQESNVRHRDAGWRRLALDGMILEDQRIDPIHPDVQRWMRHAFPEDDDQEWQTRRNLVYQLYSIQRLWTLCGAMNARDSDVFLFLRPDMEYLDPIDIGAIAAQLRGGVDLITANWATWTGLNDRFAFASRRGAEVYVSRLDHVDAFCRERCFLQAEQLLLHVATESGLVLGETAIRAMRVRSNGATWREDFSLTPKQYLRSVARKRLTKLGLPAY
ncbi:hypothetical protein [Sphingomonas sp.]|uniref:hypothetical protein n=1 Tax=Sphingomonas sp. TaxID=28214 RepID=UPI000DB54970|nr:hypothetical protein [Sphingomonas sp.]PZU08700.1 MAG: hypothetical protein DI605_12230 [Sphingomonas sp.]